MVIPMTKSIFHGNTYVGIITEHKYVVSINGTIQGPVL